MEHEHEPEERDGRCAATYQYSGLRARDSRLLFSSFVGLLFAVLRRPVSSRLGFTRRRRLQLVHVVALLLDHDEAHRLIAPIPAAVDEVVQLLQLREQGVEGLGVGDHGIGRTLVNDVVS